MAIGVLAAAFGVASARAGGGSGTTLGTTTTTGATTTTPTPTYAPLSSSSLPAGCVGAGAAAVALQSNRVVALGTPASNLGPSAYPAPASVVAFGSSTAGGSTCTSESVSLASVSLFDGAVTATNVQATNGHGTVTGLEIDGTAVSAAAGQTLSVDGWGQLTLGGKVGRLTAPLVLRLLQARDSLPAGTSILVSFAADAQAVTKPRTTHHPSQATHQKTNAAGSQKDAKTASKTKKNRRRQPAKPPPDFPATANPFLTSGALGTAAKHNAIVSTAMQYLGIPYTWGGASPKTGFDCSGLVTYVFGKLGVSLPHYAASQWYSPDAVWVRPSRLQAGDLVFFTGSDGTRKMPGHVGIYVGDGYLIDAPHTGSFVRVDSLDARWFANNYVGAKRIVGAQLLATRHLAHVTKRTAFATAPQFRLPILSGAGVDSTGVAFAATAAVRPVSRDYPLWVGAPLGGLLLLVLPGGAFAYRRRRHEPDAGPTSG